ncbi:hypothetical protein [Candidatus Poriferisodalis sp.]
MSSDDDTAISKALAKQARTLRLTMAACTLTTWVLLAANALT